jgi:hypothetical protein
MGARDLESVEVCVARNVVLDTTRCKGSSRGSGLVLPEESPVVQVRWYGVYCCSQYSAAV